MKQATRLLAALVAVGLTVTACGDDGGGTGTTSGDPLTTSEVDAILSELFDIGFDVGGQSAAASASATPIPFDESISESAACPGGGSVSLSGNISGSVDDVTFVGNLDMTLTEDISGCVITSGTKKFTVNGDPNITITASMTFTQTSLTGTFTMKGGFKYTSNDGRSGSCGIDMSVNLATLDATGNVCGQSASGINVSVAGLN